MASSTLIHHVVLGVLLLMGLVVVARRGTPRVVLGVALFGSVAVVASATVLGEDGFGRLRLLAHGVFVQGSIYSLVGAGLVWRRSKALAVVGIIVGLSIIAVAIDAFVIEPRWLEVTEYRVETDALDAPLRIVVLSDIQTDRIGEYEETVLRAALAAEPDLILLPGDFVQMVDPDSYEGLSTQMRELFRRVGLRAPLGVFAVEGNVDHPGWTMIFDGLGVTCFERSGEVELDRLRITGLSLSESHALHRSIRSEDDDRFHIVVGHYPDFALGDVEADLLVAGHTHGGQVQFPGFGPPITLSRVPRSWAAGGCFEVPGKGTLVVSRGIGVERGNAPRLRFLCRPELVVIDVVPRQP
ncbi:MAG: metallophosphoesterase [Planctomycetes bacterium]|nr:metallophosphoesterase [Planctomycetota bacterium]